MTLSGDTALTLSWSDFQGSVPAQATRRAYTSTSFDIQTPYIFRVDEKSKKQKDFKLSGVTVKLTLERSEMWSQSSGKTSALLKHEQGHYEITSLLMRDLDSDLTVLFQSAQKYPTLADFQAGVAAVEKPILDLQAKLQSLKNPQGGYVDGVYDQQTKDGTDATNQGKWNAAFAAARATPPKRLQDALTAQGITIP